MFEAVELGRSVPKSEFKKQAPILREELLELQHRLHRGRFFPVILLLSGVDGGGKHETVHLMNQWMDARRLFTCAYDEPTTEERERPDFWRYWRDMPPRGTTSMFLSAWYSRPVLDRVYDRIDDADLEKRLQRIIAFEQAYARDGALILKFWMHLSREAQEKRLKGRDKDLLADARVKEMHWAHFKRYDRFIEVSEKVIARTHRGSAPWSIVEGLDDNYRSLEVATTIRDALRDRIEAAERKAAVPKAAPANDTKSVDQSKTDDTSDKPKTTAPQTVLDHVQMRALGKKDYKQRLGTLQARLHKLQFEAKANGLATIAVFEGPDAAGKGGAIRRITASLDPRDYQVYGIAAPTPDEAAQHYLWRFWKRVPRAGRVAIYDRSWYGRVLVERIEGFATEDEWRRAYSEINDFESQLIEGGAVLLKYWIHITADEQLRRFKDREATPHKQWKLTDEDWRNRDKWNEYAAAVNDMVQFTSTREAPWTLVPGNDKQYARVHVLETMCARLAEALKRSKVVDHS